MKNFIKKYWHLCVLVLYTVIIFAVNVQINIFRYNNFDLGKFDLGNMTQMVWNTSQGRFMMLTDYFGTNLPRWSMSHVDPILVLFVPIFVLFQSPLTLVFSQLALFLGSAFVIYLIANQHLKSKSVSVFIALAYLAYPAVGFVSAWTAFHGVTVAVPFFLLSFYFFEKMHLSGNFTKRNLIYFGLSTLIALIGKEQISLYYVMMGIWAILTRTDLEKSWNLKLVIKRPQFKVGLTLFIVGVLWFVMCFFVIIPIYAKYRIEGLAEFSKSLGIDSNVTSNVSQSNYFINRYSEFGSSYQEIIFNALAHPDKSIKIFLGGDKLQNFQMTLEPVGYLPFLSPMTFMLAGPDLAINYLTTLDGVGTSEIYNHRVSMIIPVLFISVIYSLGFLSLFFGSRGKYFLYFGAVSLFILCLYKSYTYENPVYLWLTQAVQKKIVSRVFAKSNTEVIKQDLKPGMVAKISKLENKDRECALKVVKMIPKSASVSGPDYLGAHLSMRETYAIFPALSNSADYVIVDVFSKKIVNILDVDVSLIRDVTQDVIKDPNYETVLGCGNLFVFKRVGLHGKSDVLPMQEKFTYKEVVNFPLYADVSIVDYQFPSEVDRNKNYFGQLVYSRRGNASITDYILYMTFVNKKTGEMHEFVNLPSFSLKQLKDWDEGRYYIEDVNLVFPDYLEAGTYAAFIGMTNNIKTRNLYLKDIKVY